MGLDTEFNFRPSAAYTFPADPQPDGSIQHPVCMVFRELYSGRKVELFEDEFGPEPPFSVGPENLFIAYAANAEWLTFLALGWPLPERVFDPYIEYRRHICGTPHDINEEGNKGLLKAKEHFHIQGRREGHRRTEDRGTGLHSARRSVAEADDGGGS